jgi:hypothetical protein
MLERGLGQEPCQVGATCRETLVKPVVLQSTVESVAAQGVPGTSAALRMRSV